MLDSSTCSETASELWWVWVTDSRCYMLFHYVAKILIFFTHVYLHCIRPHCATSISSLQILKYVCAYFKTYTQATITTQPPLKPSSQLPIPPKSSHTRPHLPSPQQPQGRTHSTPTLPDQEPARSPSLQHKPSVPN